MSRKIKLTNHHIPVTVDRKDYEFLSQFRDWYAKKADKSGNWHAVRCVRVGRSSITVRMHRLITESAPDDRIVFLDRNGLNCRRKNLVRKKLTPWTGRANNSGFHGVTQLATNRYSASIDIAGRVYTIGDRFPDARTAAHAYDEIAYQVYGANAMVNFRKENV